MANLMKWDLVKVKGTVHTSRKSPPSGRKPTAPAPHDGPGKKWGHTCNTVKNGRYVYVFGGYGKDDCQTNDVHVFDAVKSTWSRPEVGGTLPSPRDSHSCTTVGTNLFVFGGTDGNKPLDDLFVLDTVTNTWSEPTVHGDKPLAREGHSAALVKESVFVFGGCGKRGEDSEVYFNDLYALNTKTFTWSKISTNGNPPVPRDSHTCSSYNNYFVIIGGEDADNSYLADVHILDTDTLTLKELEVVGEPLLPRAGHTTISFDKYLFVFGGFTDNRQLFNDLHYLDLETKVWVRSQTTGNEPSPRFSLAGDCIGQNGVLFFYGGCNKELEALDDMYLLDTGLRVEKGDSLRSVKKRRRENRAIGEKDMDESNKLALYEAKPVAEKIFEARINNVFHFGYTLEASIEGKQFRGILFSYKPGFTHAVHSYLSRKQSEEEISPEKMREVRKEKMRVARSKPVPRNDQMVGFPGAEHGNMMFGYPSAEYDHHHMFANTHVPMQDPMQTSNNQNFAAPGTLLNYESQMYAMRTLPSAPPGTDESFEEEAAVEDDRQVES